jgi:hypothetical protein
MGFYFRKSVTIRGIRLNISKSGISYSVSPIKGFRITTGARGTHATVGSHGFHYRERIDKPQEDHVSLKGPSVEIAGEIPTGDVSKLVDATRPVLD